MARGKAPLSLDRNGYHVSWNAIPVWVCTQCGEPFFEAREVDLIQKALNDLAVKARHSQERDHPFLDPSSGLLGHFFKSSLERFLARSYAEIGEYWDKHDLSDAWGKSKKVKFEVVAEPATDYPVEQDPAAQIQSVAKKQGVPPHGVDGT